MKSLISTLIAAIYFSACSPVIDINQRTNASNKTERLILQNMQITGETVFCVSASASASLWGTQMTDGERNGLSSVLVVGLRNEVGKLGRISEELNVKNDNLLSRSQFLADPNGIEPKCKAASAIKINIEYKLDRHGAPFLVIQEVVRGSRAHTSSIKRDVEADWKNGRLIRMSKSNPIKEAIGSDLLQRSKEIVQEIFKY